MDIPSKRPRHVVLLGGELHLRAHAQRGRGTACSRSAGSQSMMALGTSTCRKLARAEAAFLARLEKIPACRHPSLNQGRRVSQPQTLFMPRHSLHQPSAVTAPGCHQHGGNVNARLATAARLACRREALLTHLAVYAWRCARSTATSATRLRFWAPFTAALQQLRRCPFPFTQLQHHPAL